jgi:DNA invertase Pin-like site-specific DNA recombinase
LATIVDIYCRTATDDSETSANLQAQEATCRAYCEEHGLMIGIVHHEIASGVVYHEREHLSLMRERYCNGHIQGVVISRLDRLSRSQDHIATLMQEMEGRRVTLHCVQKGIYEWLH